jgi:hypothetical protein
VNTNVRNVAISKRRFPVSEGFRSRSVPVQKIYRPYRLRIFTKRNDSNSLLIDWHRKKGVSDMMTNLRMVPDAALCPSEPDSAETMKAVA